MSKRKDNPTVVIILCAIVVASIAVMVFRIGNVDAISHAEPAATDEATAENKGDSLRMIDEPEPIVSRDPFDHRILSMEEPEMIHVEFQENNIDLLPLSIAPIEGIFADLEVETSAPENEPEEEVAPEAQTPRLRFHGTVSGEHPMAMVRDDTGKLHFVRAGDQFGDGFKLVSIRPDEIILKYEGEPITLRIEEGT